MANDSGGSPSALEEFLRRTGIWQLLDRWGLRVPLGRLRCWMVPALRRQEQLLRADLRAFRRQIGPPRTDGKVRARGEKRVLLVNLSDWVVQAKLDAILANALQEEGYRPVIATYSHQRWAHEYFRVFGFDDLAFVDRLVTRQESSRLEEEARRVLGQDPGFGELLALEYRGVRIGRHVLSSIVANLRNGTIEFGDPTVQQMLSSGLPHAMSTVHAAERIFDRYSPDLVLFLERGYVPYAEFFDVAIGRGIPAIQYCQSHRSDAFVLKRYTKENRSQHPSSLSEESWEQVRRMPWTPEMDADLTLELRGRYEEGTWFDRKYLQVGKRIKSPEEVRAQLRLDPARKTAVVFSHVLWDATFFYGTNLFEDYEEWLVETVRIACENRFVNWVIKLHPDYVWKMKKAGDTRRPPEFSALRGKIGALPEHVRILEPETDISTFSLFEVTDWCVTVRGTIGIEMPCFGIPVLTAGTGRYSGLGFTVDSASREEYLDRLRRIEEIPRLDPAQVTLARKHAYALLRLRPFPFTTFEVVQDTVENLGHRLDHNLFIRAGSFADLQRAADLREFADWAANSDQEDFLAAGPDEAGSPLGQRVA